jgi:hypothetical protein
VIHEIGEDVQLVVTVFLRSQPLTRSKVANPDRRIRSLHHLLTGLWCSPDGLLMRPFHRFSVPLLLTGRFRDAKNGFRDAKNKFCVPGFFLVFTWSFCDQARLGTVGTQKNQLDLKRS